VERGNDFEIWGRLALSQRLLADLDPVPLRSLPRDSWILLSSAPKMVSVFGFNSRLVRFERCSGSCVF
jgi:hypothetical protein